MGLITGQQCLTGRNSGVADCAAVLFQTVDAVHLLDHVDGVDFDDVAAINREAVVGADSRQFGRRCFHPAYSPPSISL